MAASKNPCLSCGYCCAYFRILFYWAETEAQYFVPIQKTERFDDLYQVMRGTNRPHPRCVALRGKLGQSIACDIYDHRPGPCRDFPFSGENGVFNPRCEKLRLMHHLPPLMPEKIEEARAALLSRAVVDEDLEVLIMLSYVEQVRLEINSRVPTAEKPGVLFLRLDRTRSDHIADHFGAIPEEQTEIVLRNDHVVSMI